MGASVLLSSLCLAAVFAVPEMPEAEWDDTEVVTNAALAANPPRFLYSTDWDMMRVARRGTCQPAEWVRCDIGYTRGAIIVR